MLGAASPTLVHGLYVWGFAFIANSVCRGYHRDPIAIAVDKIKSIRIWSPFQRTRVFVALFFGLPC